MEKELLRKDSLQEINIMREVLKDTKFQKLKDELNGTKNTLYATNEICNGTFS